MREGVGGPLVSFVVPAYNPGVWLDVCLGSLINQTVVDWEAVVVDDGSTEALVSEHLKDGRVRLFRIENRGVSGARNVGLSAARGRFVCFLDADDWVEAEFIDRMVGAWNPGLAGVYCDGRIQWDYPRPWGAGDLMAYGPGSDLFTALALRPMNLGAVLFERDALRAVGGFDELLTSASEDWDFLLRAAWGREFGRVDAALYVYRVHESGFSRDFERLYRLTDVMLARFRAADRGPGLGEAEWRSARHHLVNWTVREARDQARRGRVGWGRVFRFVAGRRELWFWFGLRLLRP